MLRRLSLALALVLTGLSAPAFAQLDIQYTPTCGKVVSPRTQGGFSINGCDRTLTLKQPDGSLSTSTLLNAVTAGRKAVEAGNAGDLVAAPAGGALRSLTQVLSDEINVKALKAGVCTGDAAIDTAALNLAIAKAALAPGSTIRLPACAVPYRLLVAPKIGDTPAVCFSLPSGTTLRGDGARTVVTWNDDGDVGMTLFCGRSTRTADIGFADFTVRGSAATKTHAGFYPFLITQVDGLTFRGITSEYARGMGIAARQSTDVTATNNVVRYGQSDGINFAQCTRIAVRDNDLLHISDDGIGVHSDIYDAYTPNGRTDAVYFPPRDTVVITGNRLFDTQGIRALSARKTIIDGNVITNPKQFGISFETLYPLNDGFQEGMAAAEASIISNNVITNVIDREYLDNINQGAAYIVLTGTSARPGSLGAVPGMANPVTGLVPDPYREAFANSISTAVATPGSSALIVTGNVLARTVPLPNVGDTRFTRWSDFGGGTIWAQDGARDPRFHPVTFGPNVLLGHCIQIRDGVIRDALINGNICRGMRSGLVVLPGVSYDNIAVRGNTFSDLLFAGVYVNTPGKLRLIFEDNILDLDPYLRSAGRGPNGAWASGGPFGIYQDNGGGVFVRRNTFRNMGSVFNQGLGLGGWFFADNYVEGDIASFGAFSTSNKGIGAVPENSARLRYVRVGSDPTKADFGSVLAVPAYP